jgi:hypothetical protein
VRILFTVLISSSKTILATVGAVRETIPPPSATVATVAGNHRIRYVYRFLLDSCARCLEKSEHPQLISAGNPHG